MTNYSNQVLYAKDSNDNVFAIPPGHLVPYDSTHVSFTSDFAVSNELVTHTGYVAISGIPVTPENLPFFPIYMAGISTIFLLVAFAFATSYFRLPKFPGGEL